MSPPSVFRPQDLCFADDFLFLEVIRETGNFRAILGQKGRQRGPSEALRAAAVSTGPCVV